MLTKTIECLFVYGIITRTYRYWKWNKNICFSIGASCLSLYSRSWRMLGVARHWEQCRYQVPLMPRVQTHRLNETINQMNLFLAKCTSLQTRVFAKWHYCKAVGKTLVTGFINWSISLPASFGTKVWLDLWFALYMWMYMYVTLKTLRMYMYVFIHVKWKKQIRKINSTVIHFFHCIPLLFLSLLCCA